MGKPHSIGLRERAVALGEQGNTHTETARRLCVFIKFVNGMVRLERETGSLEPKPQGNPGRGKLSDVKAWVRDRIAGQPDLTIDKLTAELSAEHGMTVHRSSATRRRCRDPPLSSLQAATAGQGTTFRATRALLPPAPCARLERGSVVRGKPSTGRFSYPSNLPPYSPDLNPPSRDIAAQCTAGQRSKWRFQS